MSITHRLSFLPSCQAETPECISCLSTALEKFGNKLVDLNLVPSKEVREVLMVFKPKYLFFCPQPLFYLAYPGMLLAPSCALLNQIQGQVEGEKGRASTFFLPVCFPTPVLEDKTQKKDHL